MGAQVYQKAWHGINVQEAYKEAIDDSVYQGLHPHALRNKGGLSRVSLPASVKTEALAFDYVDKLLEKDAYCDKWGNMFYVEIPNHTVKNVSVIGGVKTVKNIKTGVKKWVNVFTVTYRKLFEGNQESKDFTTKQAANDFAKEKALLGFSVSLDIAKKLSDPTLANVFKMEPAFKTVKQKQSLFIFFGFYPT